MKTERSKTAQPTVKGAMRRIDLRQMAAACIVVGLAAFGSAAVPQDTLAHSGVGDARCSAERAMRAVPNRPRAVLRFKVVGENDETQFKLYRLDRNGRRTFVKHVFAGDRERFVTRKSTPWVATSPLPGGGELCIGIFVPSSRERTIVLKD